MSTAGTTRRSPRRRGQVVRATQYVVLAVVVLVVALLADWSQIRRAFFDPEVIAAQFPRVLTIAPS